MGFLKKIFFTFFLTAVLFAGKSYDNQIVVLCYHHVDPNLVNPYCVSPARFARQVDGLKAAGYSFISVRQLEKHLLRGENIPAKAVLITFDDANRSIYTYAYPILKQRNIPSIIFVYPSVLMSNQRKYFVTWKQLKEMSKNGMEVGSHSFNHPILTRPPRQDVKSVEDYNRWLRLQIVQSQKTLEAHTGLSVKYFAVPFGIMDEYVYNYIVNNSGYVLVFNVNGMNNTSYVDHYDINRWIVSNRDTVASLLQKAEWKPLEFGETYPKEYSRIDNPKPDVRFRIKNAWGINAESIKMSVNSRKELNYRFDRNTGYYDKQLKLDFSGVYQVVVTAKNNGGRLCRGTWLFLFNWEKPRFLP